MKIETKDGEGFKPFSLIITFETVREAEEVLNIFHSFPIIKSTPALNHPAVRAAIEHRIGSPSVITKQDFARKIFNAVSTNPMPSPYINNNPRR